MASANITSAKYRIAAQYASSFSAGRGTNSTVISAVHIHNYLTIGKLKVTTPESNTSGSFALRQAIAHERRQSLYTIAHSNKKSVLGDDLELHQFVTETRLIFVLTTLDVICAANFSCVRLY